MICLVIAEHDNIELKGQTRRTVAAAAKFGGEIHVLVAGKNCAAVAQAAARIAGVTKVLHSESDAYGNALAEALAPLIAALAKDYAAVLAAETTAGKNVLPRVAALLDVMQISGVVSVLSPDTFVRPIYAGNAMATVRSSDPIKVMTVRTTAFDSAPSEGGSAVVESLPPMADPGLTRFVSREVQKSERPELTAARIVVSGGRALGSKENFKLIESCADIFGGAVGASRAAVDAGYVAADNQVGQTGKIVAPELYVAIGISGAIQHLAGMKESKIIVAINKDEEAPIFQVADYGLVADLFTAVPELLAELGKARPA